METFIHQQFLSDSSVCDELIGFHKKSNNKQLGLVYYNNIGSTIDKEVKDSIDVALIPSDVPLKYQHQLQEVVNSYINKFPFCNEYTPWKIISHVGIQHYPPGGGYKQFHTERTCNSPINSSRHLVFMTYLNDVTEGGGTEFFHQKTIIQPRKGLTLIWPADWTHTHRGIVSHTQEKYIITGWFNFV
jgi:hypothetical protein